jgi:hypothetical protein
MPATAVRKRIPFLVEHPPGAEVFGPLVRGQSRSLAGQPMEFPGKCRCCKSEVTRSEVNPEYLDNLPENRRREFLDKLCAVSPSGRAFFPRNCPTCDRRGRDLEPTSAAV